MGLGLSRLLRRDDNYSGCPVISAGIGASVKLETLGDERECCCERRVHMWCLAVGRPLRVALREWERVAAAAVGVAGETKGFSQPTLQMSEFMFYGNKIWPPPPSLPPDGPCGERVIIWPIWGREPESVDVGWAVRCHAKPPVPRSLNMIPFTCPRLCTPPLPPPPPPLSLPWDRLSSTWQGLAWITGMPGQVSLRRKVSSAGVHVCMCGGKSERGRKSEE